MAILQHPFGFSLKVLVFWGLDASLGHARFVLPTAYQTLGGEEF